MLTVWVDHERADEALALFDEYASIATSRLKLDAIFLCAAIQARAKTESLSKGLALCKELATMQRSAELFAQIAVLDFYGKAGDVEAAKRVFEAMDARTRDTVCFNVMMEALSANERNAECPNLFDALQSSSTTASADAASFDIALKACVRLTSVARGQESTLC